jgi:MFS family permease
MDESISPPPAAAGIGVRVPRYPLDELGRRCATVTMVVLVAPLVAPVLGAFMLQFGWETIFIVKAIYAAALFGMSSTGALPAGVCRFAMLSPWRFQSAC